MIPQGEVKILGSSGGCGFFSSLALGLVGITSLSAVLLSSPVVDASRLTSAKASVIVEPVCSLTATVNTAHTATLVNGTYSSGSYPNGIGKSTIQAFCNDQDGYSIYAIGFTNDELGNNKLAGTGLDSTYDIITGTATSGTAGNDVSNWAMKVTAVTGAGQSYAPTITNSYDSFSEVPNTYVKVATFGNATDSQEGTNIGSSIETTYAAYISNTQPAGTYVGQVKYVLVHPNNTAAPEISISIEEAYRRTGKQKYNGYYKMQEMSDSICSMVTLYDELSQTQLIDIRDNKVYYVAKLQDGNCWMTQNLDHDIITTANFYTNENTDIGYNTSTNSYDVATWTADYATHTPEDGYWCDEISSEHAPNICSGTAIASYDPGNFYWSGQTGSYDDNEISSFGDAHYHLGNSYNWNAAVAINNSSSLSDDALIERSICPAGWTLPRAGTGSGSFYNLLDSYGFIDASNVGLDGWDSPLYLGLLGSVSDSVHTGLGSVGYLGYYWSSLLESSGTYGYAYDLTIYRDGQIDPNDLDGGGLCVGHSVRCVARPVTNIIEGLD